MTRATPSGMPRATAPRPRRTTCMIVATRQACSDRFGGGSPALAVSTDHLPISTRRQRSNGRGFPVVLPTLFTCGAAHLSADDQQIRSDRPWASVFHERRHSVIERDASAGVRPGNPASSPRRISQTKLVVTATKPHPASQSAGVQSSLPSDLTLSAYHLSAVHLGMLPAEPDWRCQWQRLLAFPKDRRSCRHRAEAHRRLAPG